MKIKKAKGTQQCVIKRNLKFKDYKKCLKASQIENKINYLEKKNIDVDCLKLILKTQLRFKREIFLLK